MTSTAMSAAAVESAKARLSPEGVASRDTAVAEPTEGAGMHACHFVRASGSMKSFMPAKSSAGPLVEVHSTRMKIIAIDDSPAVRDVRVVVIDNSPVVAPIVPPVAPTPAEAAK